MIVRFGGYERHPLDDYRLQQWTEWINTWQTSGLKSFDFLVHEPDSIRTPQTCIQFAHQLEQSSRLYCRSPRLMNTEQTLFGEHSS
jgi:hypothetical protein